MYLNIRLTLATIYIYKSMGLHIHDCIISPGSFLINFNTNILFLKLINFQDTWLQLST